MTRRAQLILSTPSSCGGPCDGEPDLLRGLLSTFIAALMGLKPTPCAGRATANAAIGGQSARLTRHRDFDTVPQLDVAIPGLPGRWLLQRRKRAERTDQRGSDLLTSWEYPLAGWSAWVETLGVTKLSKSQVSIAAKSSTKP